MHNNDMLAYILFLYENDQLFLMDCTCGGTNGGQGWPHSRQKNFDFPNQNKFPIELETRKKQIFYWGKKKSASVLIF